jgi:uncharacterized protein (TIGR03382 family)
MKMFKRVGIGLAVIVASTMLAGQASAGLMCDSRYENNTILSQGCDLGSTNNDSESQVNIDLMFGNSDWEYLWKDEDGDPMGDGITAFDMADSLLSGTFSLEWALGGTGEVLFVLKDGNGDPNTYVGWLLDAGARGDQNYAFNSPFLNTNSGSLKQISHATFYIRAGGVTGGCVGGSCGNEVPIAGTAALMPLGLIGLALARRRRKK